VTAEYIYFNGQRLARVDRPSAAVHYYFSDQLGSTGVIADASGNVQQRYFYYPYGGIVASIGSDSNHYKFTSKERDTESGLDNSDARYLGSSMSRFMSSDPMGGHPEDPQTLNRYAYVRNNPLRYTDPTGLDFYLTCTQNKDNGSTCQGGHVGTSDDKGNFTATVVTSDSLRDPNSGNTATVNGSGVQITTAQGTFGGQYFENPHSIEPENINGETMFVDHNPITLSGSGPVSGFSFFVNDNCGGTCLASGSFTNTGGTPNQTRDLLDQRGAFRSIVDRTIPVLGVSPDEMQFHPGTTQHRFGEGPSLHVSVPRDPRATVPTSGPFHVDKDAPGVRHFGCAELGVGCQ
jgi:RHS repeat-associated protein